MDIYSAEKCIVRLKRYVEGLYSCKPNMYQKSKERLGEIASTCIQVVDLISEIIEDASLCTEYDTRDYHTEFGQDMEVNQSPDIREMLLDIENKLSNIYKFIGQPKTGKHSNVITQSVPNVNETKPASTSNVSGVGMQCQVNTSSIPPEAMKISQESKPKNYTPKVELSEEMKTLYQSTPRNEPLPNIDGWYTVPRNSHVKLTSAECKHIIHTCANLLEKAPDNMPNYYARDCAMLIDNWFKARFLTNNNFKYNIKYIGKWLQCIILGYGHAMHKGEHTINQFKSMFNKWLNKLSYTQINYALPYSLFKLSEEIPEDYLVYDTVMLWGMLYDYGYSLLFNDSNYDPLFFSNDFSGILINGCLETGSITRNKMFGYYHTPELLSRFWWGEASVGLEPGQDFTEVYDDENSKFKALICMS